MAKILVVDDSKMAREVIRRSLEEENYEVLTFDPTSLFDVVKTARAFKPQVIITDYLMPNCSAELLVAVLRDDPILKQVKILALSAHHDAKAVQDMMNRGIDGFVIKGNFATLLERVKELLK